MCLLSMKYNNTNSNWNQWLLVKVGLPSVENVTLGLLTSCNILNVIVKTNFHY